MSADGAFSFSASDLSFLNQAQPFGAGPGAPGTPTSQFGSTSTPSLLGEFDDAERRFSAPNGAGVDPKHVSNTIQPMASGPTPFGNSSLSTGMDLDKDANGGAPPGRFAVAPTSHHHNHTSETAPCSHLHVRAPCCGKLVTPYPIYGVPILPVGFMPSQRKLPPTNVVQPHATDVTCRAARQQRGSGGRHGRSDWPGRLASAATAVSVCARGWQPCADGVAPKSGVPHRARGQVDACCEHGVG